MFHIHCSLTFTSRSTTLCSYPTTMKDCHFLPMKRANLFSLIIVFFSFFLDLSICSSSSQKSSILFASDGRSNYNFDIYTLPISQSSPLSSRNELKLTDGFSVNFNGYFPNLTSSTFSLLTNRSSSPPFHLIYVTERNGISDIYLDALSVSDSLGRLGSRSALELPSRVQVSLLGKWGYQKGGVSMKDRPTLVGENLIYVSTHEDSGVARRSWAAVYSTHIPTGSTRRLTPKGIADFSPAVSPSGIWTAVASYGAKGWGGEVEELITDIYVFLTRDGSSRVKVVEHGGWPCWVDDYTMYFHRRSDDDGWWGVYRAILPRVGRISTESVFIERVTPPGLHAFTPATSPGNRNFIAVATRRPGSDYRHIELFDLVNKEFKEVTRPISPQLHHLNPFISPESTRVGYHKCRGSDKEGKAVDHLLLESVKSPEPDITMFRIDGQFPTFSPNGDRIAYVDLVEPGSLYVVNPDGSNLRRVYKGMVFSTAWDPFRKGVIYTSAGPNFASESTKVDVIAINVDDEEFSYVTLTNGGENNAFPFPSPDGKQIVFRSGRSGYKNLYIMDAVEGEMGGLQRLTEGPWSDTMASWSPDGEWIMFSSDRENPGGGSFELFMTHPNGTGLHKLIQNGSGGRVNHAGFSPDGKSIVFTSDYASVSAEPISNPHHYQPYGEIFIAKRDGSEILRMTHNSYEDGTPTWGPRFLSPEDVAQPLHVPECDFEDCHWLNIPAKLGVDKALGTKAQC